MLPERLLQFSFAGAIAAILVLQLFGCQRVVHTPDQAIAKIRDQRSNKGRTLEEMITALQAAAARERILASAPSWRAVHVEGHHWTVHRKEIIDNPLIGRRFENEYVWNVDLMSGKVTPINSLAEGAQALLTSDRHGE